MLRTGICTPAFASGLRFSQQTCFAGTRSLATAVPSLKVSTRGQKKSGTIDGFFSTLDPSVSQTLPPRFADLKAELWNDGLVQSWKEILEELETETERIASLGGKVIPKVTYGEIQSGLSKESLASIKQAGVVVVTGAVQSEEALSWKKSIQEYAQANKDLVRGFPAEDPQVYEFYNTKSQTLARTHPNILNTQRALLSLWHTSDPSTQISLDTPISYFDRLRIRKPGDMKFTLGPHIDGGSVERWEDPQYRSCWRRILKGGSSWREHDPFDASPRVGAKQDLYNAPNQCSIFRPWQGWTSMSTTKQNEGTLHVLPMVQLATSYILLRPFFRPRSSSSGSLKFEDWEVDLSDPVFPGSGMGKGQELNENTHPHLKLNKTMTAIPIVQPGDQVYWHCDVVHAVESQHKGKGDSSVMYIPAVPLTEHNAGYLRDQRIHFEQGLPPP
ncbi:hypothetical protein BDP27DRAFT_1214828 [Rhodocollybia butyracea]|uniref:DUF1479-domain-containing protein n=1 Tax=Rhodocollybia butyracea TaxID=206335 RepID=A0A9P5Q332_9AGAR|nr:hypothetical protein BDP27DRAFT_1214828 [Rhodocollybia butyracea]